MTGTRLIQCRTRLFQHTEVLVDVELGVGRAVSADRPLHAANTADLLVVSRAGEGECCANEGQ